MSGSSPSKRSHRQIARHQPVQPGRERQQPQLDVRPWVRHGLLQGLQLLPHHLRPRPTGPGRTRRGSRFRRHRVSAPGSAPFAAQSADRPGLDLGVRALVPRRAVHRRRVGRGLNEARQPGAAIDQNLDALASRPISRCASEPGSTTPIVVPGRGAPFSASSNSSARLARASPRSASMRSPDVPGARHPEARLQLLIFDGLHSNALAASAPVTPASSRSFRSSAPSSATRQQTGSTLAQPRT